MPAVSTRSIAVLALALLFLEVGCADPCVSTCEDMQKCPDAEPGIDCETSCANSRDLAETFHCDPVLDAAIECEADQDDACTALETCAPLIVAYDACIEKVCELTPELCGEEPPPP
jgi:hypothetical protein